MSLGEAIMARENNQQVWIAVRIERGFPVEARGYRNRESAEKQEQIWRKGINLDYDETGVLEMKID
jgi:hypothetical protein